MYITWKQRLAQDPSLRDINSWPPIDVNTLSRSHRPIFIRNRAMTALAITGTPLKDVAQRHGVNPTIVSRLLSRELAGSANQSPALTQAMIPYQRLAPHKRRISIDNLLDRKNHQNAFQYVLDTVPGIRTKLDTMIIARLKDQPTAQVLSPAAIHGEFKRLLAEAHWPTDQYPYTTASCAYESVRRYYHERLEHLRLEHMKTPARIITSLKPFHRAFREIQIDTQTVDTNTCIHVELNSELIPLRVSRVALLLCVDVDTQCYLGHHLSLSHEPSQDDLLQLFDNITRQWSPLNLTSPGLTYTPGSGFPSMWGDEFLHLTFGEVKLDNALMHLAGTVRTYVCDDHGSTLNLGLPGAPLGRNWIEAAFNAINKTTHRFPSTTGSHPKDAIRESRKNHKRPPKITLTMLEETISVMLAHHNVTPQAQLGNQDPLSLLRHHTNNHYIRWLPERSEQYWSPFEGEQLCNVIFLKNEKRRPFIRFARLRYRGDCLNNSHLLHKNVRIRYDRRDVRIVRAYDEYGNYLGELFAPKSWQRFAHSLYTRKKIFAATKEWRFHSKDPLAEFFHHLAMNKEQPSQALEILRIYREAGRYVPAFIGDENPNSDRNKPLETSVESEPLTASEAEKQGKGDTTPLSYKHHHQGALSDEPPIKPWGLEWVDGIED
ncbi:MAG: hypothetical protein V3T17_11380 [Pseudomonadales bacterium]